MIYVLAYPIFEPKAAARIGVFRGKHEPERARLVPPHITLVFGVTDGHLKTVSDLLDKVSCQTKAFSVFFERSVIEFDPFEKKHKLFLLCGEGRETITDLHNRLYTGAHRSQLSFEQPFDPHMTLASYDEREEADQIDVSALGDLPIKAQLTALELVRLENGCLTALKTVPLIV